jgi:hypothetical protein
VILGLVMLDTNPCQPATELMDEFSGGRIGGSHPAAADLSLDGQERQVGDADSLDRLEQRLDTDHGAESSSGGHVLTGVERIGV